MEKIVASFAERQVVAVESQTAAVDRLVVLAERAEHARVASWEAAQRPPARLVRLGAGLGVPGLLGRFSRLVPVECRDESVVRCVCGGVTVVPAARVTECVGGCARWFLRSGGDVWCASFPGVAVAWCPLCGWEDFYELVASQAVCFGCDREVALQREDVAA